MPATFSHPLAVIPFRYFCPRWLNFLALVVGSLSPDFGYYIQQFPLASFAHTFLGSLVVCVPLGLLVIGAFYLLRRSFCFVLPQPHRSALMPLCLGVPVCSFRNFCSVVFSLLLGAWSHNVWDSFTHKGGWGAEQLEALWALLFGVSESAVLLPYVLQQISTFVGAALLLLLYYRWLCRHRDSTESDAQGRDRWRYALLALIAVTAMVAGVPYGIRMAAPYEGFLAFRVFIFQTAVCSIAVFVALFIVCAVGIFAFAQKRS